MGEHVRKAARGCAGGLLLAGLLVLAARCTNAVDEPPPPAAPPARTGHTMTFDAARGHVLLFGGAAAQSYRDLWAWDGAAWRRLADDGPSGRDDALLGYDAARRRVVLHGGRTWHGRQVETHRDTWEWDGGQWTRVSTEGPARQHAAGAFDPASGRFVVFGGFEDGGDVLARDTWGWDGAAWSRLDADGPARCGPHGMAYDARLARLLLLCADLAQPPDAAGNHPSRLWQWTGAAWAPAPGEAPVLNLTQHVASPGADGGLWLFDGFGADGRAGVTRRWDGTSWGVAPGANPPPRNGHNVAYDPVRRRLVLFGGAAGGRDLGDTWTWDGTAWQQAGAQP